MSNFALWNQNEADPHHWSKLLNETTKCLSNPQLNVQMTFKKQLKVVLPHKTLLFANHKLGD